MKKALESGKLWTILSALIFIMTLSLVVYAATTSLSVSDPFTSRRTDSTMGNTLTAENWNVLMNKLQGNSIPEGALMAFVGISSCPEGWTRYQDADGRFLRGGFSNIGGLGGYDKVTLENKNIPPHQHYLFSRTANGSKVSPDDSTSAISYSSNRRNGNQDYDLTAVGYTPENVYVGKSSYQTTNRYGTIQPEAFDITNPYVTVLYCIKGTPSSTSTSKATVTIKTFVSYSAHGNNPSGYSYTMFSATNPTAISDYPGVSITLSDSNRTIKVGNTTLTAAASKTVNGYTYTFRSWTNNDCGSTLSSSCTVEARYSEAQ